MHIVTRLDVPHDRVSDGKRSFQFSLPSANHKMGSNKSLGMEFLPVFQRDRRFLCTGLPDAAKCRSNSAPRPRFSFSQSENLLIKNNPLTVDGTYTKQCTTKCNDSHMSTKDSIYKIRAKRLRMWLDTHTEFNQSDLAKKLGVTRSFISGLLNNTKPFGETVAREFERVLRLPTNSLDQLTDNLLQPVIVWDKPEDLPQGVYAMIPRVNIKLSAGNGLVAEEERDVPALAFAEEWIRNRNVSSRTNLRICKVTGDSMSPFLEDGDSVMIDLGQRDIQEGKVYCIRYGDELRIKRLYKRFDGGIRVVSDNREYPEESIAPADMEHVTVLGKQIWRAG